MQESGHTLAHDGGRGFQNPPFMTVEKDYTPMTGNNKCQCTLLTLKGITYSVLSCLFASLAASPSPPDQSQL